MPESFDPYRKWLGIPSAEQPPDHYRLLGVGRFEDDADTISNAADRQMAHVRTFQAGPHSAVSQKLLNEIAAARVCLLDRAKKAEYDARLQAKLVRQTSPPPAPPVTGISPPPAAPLVSAGPAPAAVKTPASDDLAFGPSITTRRAVHKRKSPVLALVLGGAILAAAAVAVAVVLRRGDDNRENATPRIAMNRPRAQPAPAAPGEKVGSSVETNLESAPPAPSPAPTAPTQANLEIVDAAWGKGDRWQNITERVRSLMDDEGLVATADGSFFKGLNDPAFGQVKRVRIRYHTAGKSGETEFSRGEFIYLDGRPAEARKPSAEGLDVLDARYGAGATWIDALPRMRRWIHGDRLAVRVDRIAADDPVPGVRKALFLRYRTLDGEFVCHAWEGEEVVLDTRPVAIAGTATDLIAAADTDEHSTGAKWRKDNAALIAPAGGPGNLAISTALIGDYLITAVLDGDPRPDDVGITLPIGDRQVQLVVDGWGRAFSALQLVDGGSGPDNATARHGTIFELGQPTSIRCAVSESSVYATANGRVLVDWRGDVARLGAPSEATASEPSSIVLRGLATPWRVKRLEIAPLAGETPRAAAASAEVVDLLKQIDPKLDAVNGEWQMTDKGLLSPIGEWRRLGVPYLPPDDYELRLVVARQTGQDALGIGLVVDGRCVEAVVDGWQGTSRGLNGLDGKPFDHNATTKKGTVFVDDQPKEIVCTVHPASVRVASDGRTLIEWHGDARRFSFKAEVPDQLGLHVGAWNTGFLISRLEIRPLPPEKPDGLASPAEIIGPSEKPAASSERPRSPAELTNNSTGGEPETDQRLPVPTGKELTAAEKKVAEKFEAQWDAAKTLPDGLKLARKVYESAVQTNDDPTLRYALLREALHRASGLGDAPITCDAIDQLGRDFQIDPLAEKLAATSDALEKARLPTQLWTLAACALVFSDGALAAQRYDEARKFASLVTSAGRRTRRNDLTKYAERRLALIRSRHERHTRLEKALARLREQPDDVAANLTAGVELCLLQGDWQLGLPLLAKSGEKRLVKIARLEAAAGQDLALRPALVDTWLAEAPNQNASMRGEYELQGKYWLDRGLPDDAPADEARKRLLEKLAQMPSISSARVKPGLEMAMFDGADFQQFRARRVAQGLNHNFGFGGPHPTVSGDNFSVRWTGWLKPPLPGKYVIHTNSDDGVRVRINGKLVIDRWHRGAGDETAEIELTDQIQPLSVEFNDTGVTAAVRVAWKLKDLSDFQIVPPEALFHDPAIAAAE